MNAFSILMIGGTMINIKYDSKKQLMFEICQYIIIFSPLIYITYNQNYWVGFWTFPIVWYSRN
jgi:hypothetical protein